MTSSWLPWFVAIAWACLILKDHLKQPGNGTLIVNRERWEVISESDRKGERMQAIPLQPADTHRHVKHVQNFVESVRARKRPVCDIGKGHDVALVAHMGNIAYKTENQLRWDATKGKFADDPEANELVQPAYRPP